MSRITNRKRPSPTRQHDPIDVEFRRKLRKAFIVGGILVAAPLLLLPLSLFLSNLSTILLFLSLVLEGSGLIYVNYQLQEAYNFKLYKRLATLFMQGAEEKTPQPPPISPQTTPPLPGSAPTVLRPAQSLAPRPRIIREQVPYVQRPPSPQTTMQQQPQILSPARPKHQSSTQPAMDVPQTTQPRQASAKVCPNCGRELPFGDLHLICPFCGAQLR